MTDRAWQEWERRRDHITKPRVSWCPFTRKWIMAPSGNRHVCSRSWKPDMAFRHWDDAMAEAHLVYRERVRKTLGSHNGGCKNRW